MKATLVISVLLVTSVITSVGIAQISSSTLDGTVTDPTGAVVAKATVTATSTATGFSRSVGTSDAGVYSIRDLPPGIYDLSVEARGFKRATATGLRLFVGQTITSDIRLEVGALAQAVTVSAAPPLLQESESHIGTVIETRSLTDLPLNGRNFLQLNLLSPGVVRHKGSSNFESWQLDPSATGFNVNGQRQANNNYLLDGLTIKEFMNAGAQSMAPNVDAIQEFQTTTSNYSAAFGAEAGGQVTLVTKSGTNKLRGVAYEFLRNNELDARNFFAQTQGAPPRKRNQFGGTIGGPVDIPKVYNGKDRTFFFFSEESIRDIANVPILTNLPTPAQYGGDLSSLVSPGKPLIDPFTGLPFQNGVIPANRIPSTLVPFLQNGIGKGAWLPLPNSTIPGSNFSTDSRRAVNSDEVIVRIDQKINDRTFAYGRYGFQNLSRQDPNYNPNWFVTEADKGKSVGGHLSRTFSPTFTADFTFGYGWYHANYGYSTFFKNDITNQILKIRGLTTIPDNYGAPSWGVTGFTDLGETFVGPRSFGSSIYEWGGAFTLARGKHSLRFGADVKRYHDDFDELVWPNGSYSFDGRFTGYSLGDFLLGLPSSGSISTNGFLPKLRHTYIGPYVQDDWKVTPNLTLNLGLRYDLSGIPLSANKSVANVYFPPNHGTPVPVISDGAAGILYHGRQQPLYTGVPFVTASSVGLPQALAFNDKKDFAPRFGFAYRIPGMKDTVIRGGYGVFYQVNDVNDKYVEAAINLPFIPVYTFNLDSSTFRDFNWFDPTNGGNLPATGLQTLGVGIHARAAMEQAWNLTLERVKWGTSFSVAYVGNTVHHLTGSGAPNQALPGPGPYAPRRPWPTVGPMIQVPYDFNANYQSGQFKAQRPMSQGLSLLLAYTWSKAINDSSGYWINDGDVGPSFEDPYNIKAMKALGSDDVRHRVTIGYIYELPVGKGKRFLDQSGVGNVLLGGWQINGITTFQSGSPFTVTQVDNGSNTDAHQFRPDLIANPNRLSHSRPRGEQVNEFFDTSAFQANMRADPINGPFRYGTAGRNVVIGPGINNFDFSLYKDFKFQESRMVQFRTEVFNIFNRPDFNLPGSTLGTPQFGKITSTFLDAREIQFALKLYF